MPETPQPLVMIDTPADGVLCLTLNRPSKRNALSFALRQDLADALNTRVTPDIRVVLITGQDGFSAGADLSESATINGAERMQSWALLWEALATAQTRAPVAVAVEGYAMGAGFELSLASDLIIAANDAKFGLPEVSFGFLPGGGGTQRLVRSIGKHRAMSVILAKEIIDAPDGKSLGFVSVISKPGQAFETALEVCKRIASYPANAVLAARRAIVEGSDMPLEDGLALEYDLMMGVVDSPDLVARASAFVAKPR